MASQERLLNRLGGPPGRYAVLAAGLAVCLFPLRLLLDAGDPVLQTVAVSGLYGTVWGLFPTVIEWLNRKAGRADRNPRVQTPAERGAWLRYGARLGLAVGVPFFGAMIALCLSAGLPWNYTVPFVVALLILVVAAIRSRRAATPGPADPRRQS